MRYSFKDIENGQITEGYTTITITDHQAKITDEAEILLAEKHGGELAETPPKPKKSKAPDTTKLPDLDSEPKDKLSKQESKGD